MDRVKAYSTRVSSAWVVTKNARNYQNDLLSVIAPFITTSHGVHVTVKVHPEAAHGKGLVDVQLYVAMRHVHRLVRKSGKGVCPPRELWNALHNGEGILNYRDALVTVVWDDPHL